MTIRAQFCGVSKLSLTGSRGVKAEVIASLLLYVDSVTGAIAGDSEDRALRSGACKVRLAARLGVEAPRRENLQSDLLVLRAIGEVPKARDDYGGAGIAMRMGLDDGIWRDLQLDRVEAGL